ncbi:MAG: Peptidoglycan glycosyltransferase [Rhodospirillales bacterium]|nr:Peptidoglycan glycosyltransferase [Rhodospirillales bacterium]
MRFLLIGLSALGILAAGGIVAVFLLLRHYSEGLPDYRALADYKPKVVTRIHAGDGELLAEFSTEKRIFVPIGSIPKEVKEAFISAEDKNFYQHKGVDPEGIMRAAVTDLKNLHSEKRPVGASTITQQVARNFLLTNEVSIARKIKEMILAYRIEQVLTKDQILELYLNEIYLGLNSYGVAAAALDYFDKPLDELTIAEMSFLAAIPKNPNKYFREKNRDAALERRNYVINRMFEDKYITQARAAEAIASPLGFHPPTDSEKVPAGHFTEEVRRELLAAYGKEGLYGGGLSVRTTLDPRLQAIAVRSLRDGLVAYDQRHGWRGPVTHLLNMNSWAEQLAKVPPPDGAESWRLAAVIDADADSVKIGFSDGKTAELAMADMRWTGKAKASAVVQPADVILVQSVEMTVVKPDEKKGADKKKGEEKKPAGPTFHYVLRQMPEVNGALVGIDPHTGRVLALVGGMSYESSEFDRATQAMRQPGSSFKPFVFLAALDSGFTPSTIVLDAPIEIDQGPGLPLWKPENFDHEFLGPLPLRVALEKSLDTATVRVGQAVGMPKIVDYAKKFGISDNLPPFISSVIGAGETTLMRMVTAYAELDNGGKKIVPTLIDRIQDREGTTLFRHDTRTCQGCTGIDWNQQAVPEIPDDRLQIQDPRTAYQMVEMLEGVVQRGTARSLAALGHPLAGKTGTTNEAKDLWFLGFSPDLVVGVFVGYDDPKSLGKHEQGATTAVPIFKEFMSAALADQPPIPFRIPTGLRLVRVDASSGGPAGSGSANSLWEAFLPGTEPGADHPAPPGAELLTNAGSQNLPSATTGTGGIY